MEAGFDALHPMEAKAGCDVIRFAEQYGDRIAFVGGLDERIIESGDREQIRDGIVRIIKAMKNLGARYVFSSDHSISTNVRLSDYQYAIEVCREHMMY
jgi:uroporphyrinogen-III decarboxylase